MTSNGANDTFVSWESFESAGSTLNIVPFSQNRIVEITLSPSASLAALAANVQNPNCGKVRQTFRFSALNASGYRLVNPNPVDREVVIQPAYELEVPAATTSSAAGAATSPLTYSATLYDSHSMPVRSAQGTEKTTLNVQTLRDGVYYLKVVDDYTVTNQQVIVKH